MNKQEASKQLANLEAEVAKLKKIIEAPEKLIGSVSTYKEVCKILEEKELTICDFNHLPEYMRVKQLAIAKLIQICKLFNGIWKLNWKDCNQRKWRPYFDLWSSGWVFTGSYSYIYNNSHAEVVYFESEEISNYIGKTFLDIYKDVIE